MSKYEYPYPPDEFDLVDASARPEAAHEAKQSPWSKAWPFLVVIIVVPAIAFGVVKYLSTSDSPEPAPPPSPTRSASATPSPKPSKTLEATPTPTPSPEQAADRTAVVQVLNSSQTDGLAGQVQNLLINDGWTNTSSGNYVGSASDTPSAVYYHEESQKITAQAAAAVLGINVVELNSSEAPQDVTVVLRSGYRLP